MKTLSPAVHIFSQNHNLLIGLKYKIQALVGGGCMRSRHHYEADLGGFLGAPRKQHRRLLIFGLTVYVYYGKEGWMAAFSLLAKTLPSALKNALNKSGFLGGRCTRTGASS